MLTTTFRKLKEKKACKDGYKKLAENLGGFRKYGNETPISLLQILDSNGSEDAVWCFRATIENSDYIARKFAVMCAERVLHIFEKEYPDDNRPRKCIETIWKFLDGKATYEELDAARDAAWDAARYAARDAAWDAARYAARDARYAASAAASAAWDARYAARDAAWDARYAARDARDAEKKAQELILRELLESEG
jgi:hypothetical protein